jgi:hypothetical protein
MQLLCKHALTLKLLFWFQHELEEEKLLAAKQQENLNVNYEMMETMDSVLLSGMSNYLCSIYNVNWNGVF